jgi:oleate hydratase
MDTQSKKYLVGGGIASLSAAVYLIQDGKIKGEDIVIFDESKRIGGSLDAQNLSTSEGYVMRGIRMFEEEAYTCSFDLMARIPSLNMPGKNLREEFVDYNSKNKSYSKSRLLKDGEAIDSRPLKLNLKDRLNLIHLFFKRESVLEDMEIQHYFTPQFFTSNFWYEFCTVFAFQPWHGLIEFRRYLMRFVQSFSSIDTLENIESSPYNQYEFLVLPIIDWLIEQGVTFVLNTKVSDIDFVSDEQGNRKVCSIRYSLIGGEPVDVSIRKNDHVFITLGSMVAGSYVGSMKTAPLPTSAGKNFSWDLWRCIAEDRPEFGVPSVFDSHVDKSKWTSFTVTFRDPLFFSLIEKFIHKKVTAYGGVNLIDSNWFMSIVLSYKPYFLNQPDGVNLCWGYGLSTEKVGNIIKKKMSECTGEEILTELVHHLGFEEHLETLLKTSVCIPCVTPYVTSQFLPRKKSDRPLVRPKGSVNFAFLGQYCEMPDDVVFTVEYSIRSAQTAVCSLLVLDKKIPPIYKGLHHAKVLFNAFRTILR